MGVIAATLAYSVIRIAVGLTEGGRVILTGKDWPTELRFGEGMLSPRVAFTNDGLLVAASRGCGRVYDAPKRP